MNRPSPPPRVAGIADDRQPMTYHVTARRIARALAVAFAVAGAMAVAQGAQEDAAAASVDVRPQGDEPGDAVAVDVQQHDGTVVIRATALVDADAATAWRVLTDYGRYREFVPGLRTSRVVARQGLHVTVEQTGVAPLWLLSVPMTITYDIVESPPTSLRSRAYIPGAGVLRSSYALLPADGRLRLAYLGTVAMAPGPMTALREGAAERAIVDHFHALVDEMERRPKRLGPSMASAPRVGDGATTQ
jgi:hypothetical protein